MNIMHSSYYTCTHYLGEVMLVSLHVGGEQESHGRTAENASGQNVPCQARDKLQASCLFGTA